MHVFALLLPLLLLVGCGPSEQELQLTSLEQDLQQANAIADSLTAAVQASSRAITGLRAHADSLQQVDERLLRAIQSLNREATEWRRLATERRQQSEQLVAEVARMRREKQTDERAIAQLRARTDSLASALVRAHVNAQRQSAYVARLETELGQSQEELARLRQSQGAVRVLIGTEAQLVQSGNLLAFQRQLLSSRRSYRLVKRIDAADPGARLAPIGEPLVLARRPRALVDRIGRLEEGRDYRLARESGEVRITFANELMAGSDVLVLVEE